MLMIDRESYMQHAMKDGGFTAEEAACCYHILMARSIFLQLPVQHRDEEREQADAIHVLQNLMAMRVARREHPAFWRNEEILND